MATATRFTLRFQLLLLIAVAVAVAVPAAFYSLTPFYDRFLACKIIKTLHTANNEPNNKQQQAEQAK